MSRRNVEIIRAGYEAFLRGDRETAFGFFSSDIEAYDDPEMVGEPVYRGREGFAHMLALTTDGFEDVRYTVEQITDVGRAVMVHAKRSGRGVASGVEVEEHQWHVWDLRDGEVTKFQLFHSRDEALRAAGKSLG